MNDDGLSKLHKQSEIIIGLLARMIWTPEQISNIVIRGKKNPDAYRKVYNALDGIKTGTQLAALAGVKQQTISEIIRNWDEFGIVANVGTDVQPRYKRLMPIPNKAAKKGK
jgi:hypothetical protein